MTEGVLTATPIERDIVMVEGSDARSYLQTQLSQDIEAIDLAQSAWSFILDPKGSIEALVRITRIGHDRLTLDVEPGYGDSVRARLDGHLFRTDARFSQSTWPGVAWRGDGSSKQRFDAPIVSVCSGSSPEGIDVIGPNVSAPANMPTTDLEVLRIQTGWPAMGNEITEGITPAMTGLIDITVSFDKGCYTGQELVARTHHRGAAPTKRLVRVTAEPGTAPARIEFTIEDQPAGEITSMLASGEGLGYLARKHTTPVVATAGDHQVNLTEIG
ncbi:MAG: hypothetical protein M5U23_00125 [Acidimicrobiia bacterium]|nr:hypothetical protein [Acidimicrobiia bacterium]